MELSESLEDYLETILSLEKTQKVARAKDIAEILGIQRGSVTSALKNLASKGLINYAPYSFITLTAKGAKIAKEITYRHKILKDFLVNVLHIDEKTAELTACRMEHTVDKKTLKRMICFFDFIFMCPRAGTDWVKAFAGSCESGKIKEEECEICLEECMQRFETR